MSPLVSIDGAPPTTWIAQAPWRRAMRAARDRIAARLPMNPLADWQGVSSNRISIVITAYNEGDELARTVASLAENTNSPFEIIVVDDGSNDDSCSRIARDGLQIIHHPDRLGVAPSRSVATAAATGDVFVYFDAHQRVSPGCVDRIGALALKQKAIVWPSVRGFLSSNRLLHGAEFAFNEESGCFSAEWNLRKRVRSVNRITALRAPGYVIPRSIYDRVGWIQGLSGWGGSEAAVSLKAFFADVKILHLRGPVAWHRFKRQFHFNVSWEGIWRNHALIARVCFDDRTWFNYWLPEVFDRRLTVEARRDLECDLTRKQHEEFLAIKVRRDREFWTDLLRREPPAALR